MDADERVLEAAAGLVRELGVRDRLLGTAADLSPGHCAVTVAWNDGGRGREAVVVWLDRTHGTVPAEFRFTTAALALRRDEVAAGRPGDPGTVALFLRRLDAALRRFRAVRLSDHGGSIEAEALEAV